MYKKLGNNQYALNSTKLFKVDPYINKVIGQIGIFRIGGTVIYTELQLIQQKLMSVCLHDNKCHSQKILNVIQELLEAQCGQVRGLETPVGPSNAFCEFYF